MTDLDPPIRRELSETNMQVVIPFCPRRPKTRLSSVLSNEERQQFARVMLRDVVSAVRSTGSEPKVLSTERLGEDVAVTIDEGKLSDAINRLLKTANDDIAVIMADLPLATPSALSRLFETKGDIVIAPGRGGGTNGLVVRHDKFDVDYHGNSYEDHRRCADAIEATVSEIDSFTLATDIDEPEDLVEVLLHSRGEAGEWLRDAGFSLETTDGRVSVGRNRRRVESR